MTLETREAQAGLREFHLIPEPFAAKAAPRAGAEFEPPEPNAQDQCPAVVVPDLPAELRKGSERLPTAVVLSALQEAAQPVVEPLWAANPPRLLLVAPQNVALRMNGLPAPRVLMLREGDHVQWNEEVAFQVAIFQRPRLGAPGADQLGRPCPVCTLPLTDSSRVYVCGHCGVAMHCEEIESGFECARLRTECVCGRPIRFHAGYNQPPDWR